MRLPCFLIRTLVLLALLGLGREVAAQPSYLTTIPDPKTLGESYVSDPDHLLQAATVQELNALLRPLDQSGRAHIDVVLTRSIGEEVPKTAATALFNSWKIGDKELNNGLLILLVEDQRRVEFETGYGLEADLPDILCYRIQQRYMVPALRQQQYDEAVRQGVAAVIRQLSTGHIESSADSTLAAYEGNFPNLSLTQDDDAASTGQDDGKHLNSDVWPTSVRIGVGAAVALLISTVLVLWFRTKEFASWNWVLLLGLVGILFIVVLAAQNSDFPVVPGQLMALCYAWPLLYLHVYLLLIDGQFKKSYADQSRHARYTFLNQAHHGLGWLRFVFPLGLALYWPRHRRRLAALRDAAYACPVCAQPMQRLDETQDDVALQPGHVEEERIASIDYDVWQCPAGHPSLILDYANLSSNAKECVKCHHRTSLPQPDEVMEAATTSSGGWGWHVHLCTFCQHVKKVRYTTSRLSSSSSSSSGSSSSGSSSSSGGSSGGGGAGSSW